MSRLAQPQLSFADLELRRQGVHLDPLLQGILSFLDDQATLVEQVRQDLVRGPRAAVWWRSGGRKEIWCRHRNASASCRRMTRSRGPRPHTQALIVR